MNATETAHYFARESITKSAQVERTIAGVVGRKDQRTAGGRDTVLAACRALGGVEGVAASGYTEFCGNLGLDFYRVVVI